MKYALQIQLRPKKTRHYEIIDFLKISLKNEKQLEFFLKHVIKCVTCKKKKTIFDNFGLLFLADNQIFKIFNKTGSFDRYAKIIKKQKN